MEENSHIPDRPTFMSLFTNGDRDFDYLLISSDLHGLTLLFSFFLFFFNALCLHFLVHVDQPGKEILRFTFL